MNNNPSLCENQQYSPSVEAKEILSKRYRSINAAGPAYEQKDMIYKFGTFELLQMYAKHPGLRDQVEGTSFDSNVTPRD